MPRKTRDQRVEARRKRIEARGFKRAAARDVRKEERTERLAARKGLTTDQASRLQENRRQRFREFAAGGTENITTGRLRFSSDPSGESNPAGQAGAMDVERNQANATLARQAQATAADRASMLDGVVARDYRRSPLQTGRVGTVEVGEHDIEQSAGFSRRARGASGYST